MFFVDLTAAGSGSGFRISNANPDPWIPYLCGSGSETLIISIHLASKITFIISSIKVESVVLGRKKMLTRILPAMTIEMMSPYMATASQKMTEMRFLVLMRGALTPPPMMEVPVV